MNVLEVSDNPNVLNPHSVSFQERMKQLETENATEKKNCKYSSFPANVVLALSEQDKQYQINLKKVKTETKKILLKNKQKKV